LPDNDDPGGCYPGEARDAGPGRQPPPKQTVVAIQGMRTGLFLPSGQCQNICGIPTWVCKLQIILIRVGWHGKTDIHWIFWNFRGRF
jgi:hypothetical protein